jgi:uncharacterized membrane protein YebE (DUF533 family)
VIKPFDWEIYYHLPFLLIVVSLVYSATRHDRWDRILKEAAGWVFRMGGFLAGLGVVLYTLSSYQKAAPYIGGLIAVGMVVYYTVSSPWYRKWREKKAKAAAATAPVSATPPAR